VKLETSRGGNGERLTDFFSQLLKGIMFMVKRLGAWKRANSSLAMGRGGGRRNVKGTKRKSLWL